MSPFRVETSVFCSKRKLITYNALLHSIEHSHSEQTELKMDEFQKINFEYSLKDIPTSSKKEYLIKLYDAISKFINRIRWKIFHSNKTDDSDTLNLNDENIFKSSKSAPPCDELKAFEKELFDIAKNIKFNKNISPFQKKMKNDLKSILVKNKIIIFADKTRNLYSISPKLYKKLLLNNITSGYKITDAILDNTINSESEKIINERGYKSKKIPKFSKLDAFITVKDHKENFPSKIECRVLNPSKNSLGMVSKNILEKIVAQIKNKSKITQWKNTDEVIAWFNSTDNKKDKCFINFDIKNYYPSINEKHLKNAIDFAKKYIKINDEDIKIIKHTCKSILSYDNNIWIKKEQGSNFDVPMGSYFGAELCELIGLYILNELQALYDPKDIGLYRDDGLAIIKRTSSQQLETLKKMTIKSFQNLGLQITISVGMNRCNFLDLTLDLTNNTYKPYRKENSCTKYINRKSNHPPVIKRNLPSMIEKRLSKLSKDEKIFKEAAPIYQAALNKSNFKHKLSYNKPKKSNTKCNRKRKITFFNPPFCQSVRTNIGKKFLNLIDKHFKNNDKMRKMINRNNCKVSYCCMANVKTIISGHNKKTLKLNSKSEKEKMCNCRKDNPCPLNNKCLNKNVIYKATVKSENSTKSYIGSTANTFKARWYAHKSDFKNAKNNGTELSKHIWNLKNKNKEFEINWEILHHIGEVSNIRKICSTCNLEKVEIAIANNKLILNKRNELISSCPHLRNLYFKT